MTPRTLPSGEIPWEEIPLFARLDEEDLSRLRPLGMLREYHRDERVFDQGDPSEMLYFVVSGRVKVVKSRPDGNELILEILGPGDPLGVVAALEEFPFPAAAVVHQTSRVLSLPRREFLGFTESHSSMVRGLLAGLSRRNMQLTRRLSDFPGTVEARIARLFHTLALRMAQPGQGPEGAPIEIPLALTRQEVADLVGTTLETAIRILSRWGKEGIVLTHKDGFTLRDLGELERLRGGG